ncbi:pseudoazurin [Salicola sp. Rm-C-2C1-2]|uniref:pseudoazurin n=1 Tax=Salicola sp. Rm-C-2C1-2 TaxID=3141321 RepID=UPI0032E37F9E
MITRKPLLSLTVVLLVLSSTFSLAEQHTIEMKNRGEDGNMVFEPGYLKVQPGDTIQFLATDPTHNSVSDTVPEDAESWSGAIDEEITVTLSKEGVYVYKCAPHLKMNMTGIIQVGEPTNYGEAQASVEKLTDVSATNEDRLRGYFRQVPIP